MNVTEDQKINGPDLPALHEAANIASLRAQKRYLSLFTLNLVLLALGSLMAALSALLWPPLFAVLSGVLFTFGLILAGAMAAKRYEKTWYGGRAVAESVKTLAWRYVAGAEPYEWKLSSRDADEKFAADLQAVLLERKYLSGSFDGDLSTRPQITDKMRAVRDLATAERKAFYINGRIEDQRKWYAEKARTNQNKEWRWFWVIMFAQLAAAASAFFLAGWPQFRFRFTSVFATLATASIAWLQVKRYQELAQSYNLAAQELGVIASKALHVQTDEELSKFVGDAENAISREHTLWVARRDQT